MQGVATSRKIWTWSPMQWEPYLRTNGIRYRRNTPGTKVGQAIRGIQFRILRFAPGASFQCRTAFHVGEVQGTDVYYYPYSAQETGRWYYRKGVPTDHPEPSWQKRFRPRPWLKYQNECTGGPGRNRLSRQPRKMPSGFATHYRPNCRQPGAVVDHVFWNSVYATPQAESAGNGHYPGGPLNIRERPSMDTLWLQAHQTGPRLQYMVGGRIGSVVGYQDVVGYAEVPIILPSTGHKKQEPIFSSYNFLFNRQHGAREYVPPNAAMSQTGKTPVKTTEIIPTPSEWWVPQGKNSGWKHKIVTVNPRTMVQNSARRSLLKGRQTLNQNNHTGESSQQHCQGGNLFVRKSQKLEIIASMTMLIVIVKAPGNDFWWCLR